MIIGIDKCYYCGEEPSIIIKWKYEKVLACNNCSKKTTGKIEHLNGAEVQDGN